MYERSTQSLGLVLAENQEVSLLTWCAEMCPFKSMAAEKRNYIAFNTGTRINNRRKQHFTTFMHIVFLHMHGGVGTLT